MPLPQELSRKPLFRVCKEEKSDYKVIARATCIFGWIFWRKTRWWKGHVWVYGCTEARVQCQSCSLVITEKGGSRSSPLGQEEEQIVSLQQQALSYLAEHGWPKEPKGLTLYKDTVLGRTSTQPLWQAVLRCALCVDRGCLHRETAPVWDTAQGLLCR